ncbi:unnamed protein product [Symbiodinium natans]|uniref:Macro domain-containing protein n=1 Tax=Symbiodinium natans TaxID=878477 RepID=A0A812I486_9DINO|nr:unnamed protein product [Symbiodinium natans]
MAEAKLPNRGVEVQVAYPVKKTQVVISAGSVVDFSGDAIVNAANRGGLGGGGVDGAINSAGGPELIAARRELPVLDDSEYGDRIRTGEARVTIGGKLAVKWVIHAVGPIYWEVEGDDFKAADDLLYAAYASSLNIAKEKEVKSLAFCLLSAGIFRGERALSAVLEIGCQAVKDHVYDGLEEVHIVAFTETEIDELLAAAQRVFSGSKTFVRGRSCPQCTMQ